MEESHLGSKVSEMMERQLRVLLVGVLHFRGWSRELVELILIFSLTYNNIFCRLHSSVYELCDL